MSFTTEIGTFSKGTQTKVQSIRRGVIIKLFSAVILDTPVDTGRLRANWRLSEGKPDTGTSEAIDKSGGPTVAAMTQGVLASKGDATMYLSNNLPYAARIEFDGWSKVKQPFGMVRKNIARFNELIQVEGGK